MTLADEAGGREGPSRCWTRSKPVGSVRTPPGIAGCGRSLPARSGPFLEAQLGHEIRRGLDLVERVVDERLAATLGCAGPLCEPGRGRQEAHPTPYPLRRGPDPAQVELVRQRALGEGPPEGRDPDLVPRVRRAAAGRGARAALGRRPHIGRWSSSAPLSLGEEKDTKTRSVRTVNLLAPLAEDLAAWRMICRDPAPGALVFPRATASRGRTPTTATGASASSSPRSRRPGIALGRPYDLRHAFVSLLFAEGRSVVYVAAQAGHAPTMTLDTYAHVIDELEGGERRAPRRASSPRRAARICAFSAHDPLGAPPAPHPSSAALAGKRAEAL